MSLTRALSNAYSGLFHSSRSADVTSNNIANAQTPGYVRREVIAQERVTGSEGNGVATGSIERAQDLALSRTRRDADGGASRAAVLAGATQTLNQEIGEPGSAFGLFTSLENLEASLQQFAVTPENGALQTAVVTAAQESATQINALAHVALSLRETAELQIENDVETVNTALHRLKQINGDIASLNASSGETAAIEDERQQLLDKISNIIPIKDIAQDNDQIHVITEGGTYLLSSKVTELSFERAKIIPDTARYGDGSNVLSGLWVGEQEVTPGQTNRQSISGGSISGHFTVRDEIAPNFTDRMDSLSAELIRRFSSTNVDPTITAGSPGLFTDAGGIGALTNPAGSASRLQINARVDTDKGGELYRIRDGLGAITPGESGNSEIALNLLGAMQSTGAAPANSGLSGFLSISEIAAGLSSVSGEESVRFEAQSVSATARATVLGDSELQRSGVDVDSELQSLLIIEQAYAANARVIQTVGEMIDRLLNL